MVPNAGSVWPSKKESERVYVRERRQERKRKREKEKERKKEKKTSKDKREHGIFYARAPGQLRATLDPSE